MPDCILRTSRSCFSKAFIGSPILTTCAAARCAGAGRCRACRRGGALWGRVAMSYSCTQQTNKQHGRALQIQVPIGRQATGGVAVRSTCSHDARFLCSSPSRRKPPTAPHSAPRCVGAAPLAPAHSSVPSSFPTLTPALVHFAPPSPCRSVLTGNAPRSGIFLVGS
jgi:hypothetical protein